MRTGRAGRGSRRRTSRRALPIERRALRIDRLLAGRADEVIRQRRQAARTADARAIHRLRVATRRLQEALDFARPVLADRPRRRLERRTRELRRGLGRRRNLDVMRDLLRSLEPRLRGDERPAARRLARVLEERARGTPIDLPGIGKRIRALLDGTAAGPILPLAARGRQVIAARAREVDARLVAGRGGDAERLHRLRIAIKRFRYALEILDEAGVPGLGPSIRSTRGMQRTLGMLHDLDMLLDLARRAVSRQDREPLIAAFERLRRVSLADTRVQLGRFRARRGTLAIVRVLRPERAG
jgi:CHAD domain-containing protein